MQKDKVEIKIEIQGTPELSHGYGYGLKGNDEAVCFYVDLDTKYCEVLATLYDLDGACGISIGETERTPVKSVNDKYTEICFPEFKGWSVHCATIYRYTIAVALINNK